MKKLKVIVIIALIIGLAMMISGVLYGNTKLTESVNLEMQNLSASTSMIVKKNADSDNDILATLKINPPKASITRIEVFDGLTIEELAAKLDRNLGNDIVAGKGMYIATECLNNGVDPYVATAILLQETGCKFRCSQLARTCNNFGGQKGAPGCNGGSYKAYNTMEEGLTGFIVNLSRNYYSQGLTTVESIGPKYAESKEWPAKINMYVSQIRSN